MSTKLVDLHKRVSKAYERGMIAQGYLAIAADRAKDEKLSVNLSDALEEVQDLVEILGDLETELEAARG